MLQLVLPPKSKGTTAAGTYDNIKVAAGQATATIGVYDQLNTEVTDTVHVSTITAPGVKPVLQDTVALTYADGSVESGHESDFGAVSRPPVFRSRAGRLRGRPLSRVSAGISRRKVLFFVVAPSDPKAQPIVAIDFDSAAPGSGLVHHCPGSSPSPRSAASSTGADKDDRVQDRQGRVDQWQGPDQRDRAGFRDHFRPCHR